MSYTVKPTKRFEKDLKRVHRRGYDIALITAVIKQLAAGEPLPAQYKDHALTGNFAGCRECHITPDWLLVYEIDEAAVILYLTRTGTHSDLF